MVRTYQITQERVRELFTYVDGELIRTQCKFNSNHLGKPSGTRMPKGYKNVGVDGKYYGLHQLVYLYFHGYIPPLIDHIDQNPGNNRIGNLRSVTRAENALNGKQRVNKLGYKGVRKTGRKFAAQISVAGKTVCLGYFETIKEAAKAYDKAAMGRHGSAAILNFKEDI